MIAEREIRPITDKLARAAFDRVRAARDHKLDLMIGTPTHPPIAIGHHDTVYLNTALKLFFDFLSFQVLHQDSPDPNERRHLVEVMINEPELLELYLRFIRREIRYGTELVEVLDQLAFQHTQMKKAEWAEEADALKLELKNSGIAWPFAPR